MEVVVEVVLGGKYPSAADSRPKTDLVSLSISRNKVAFLRK